MDQVKLTPRSRRAYDRIIAAAIQLADRPELRNQMGDSRAAERDGAPDIDGIVDPEPLAEALAGMIEQLTKPG